MLRNIMKSKIHKARITRADLYYEGSLTIDRDLMEAANIIEHEMVYVVNVNNGERLETYCIPGERGSGAIGLNGAAARKGAVGDEIIIMTYAQMNEEEIKAHQPIIIICNENNSIKKRIPSE